MSDAPTIIRIEVPGEPKGVARAKARAVTSKSGRTFAQVYTPAATRNEAAVIRDYAECAMAGRSPLTVPIDLRVTAYVSVPKSMPKRLQAGALATPPTVFPAKKPDYDNIAKFAGDALNKIVFVDDSQVVDHHFWKRYSDRPRLVIEVRAK